jgi:hypothetical protein
MTNPTTPFSWQMPTASDLVTDLPADFETFGQAVATSMADLLGGTTGQVLSKASNTDMDFTWVTSDDANAIQNAIVDAKGDLIAASAADTPARLAVGNNGETLVADSSTSTGLRYQSAYNGNGAINGGLDNWQRGTSFTTNGYSADRWYFFPAGVAGRTLTRQSSGLTGFDYSARVARNSGNTDTTAIAFIQSFATEEALRFAGQTATVSFYAKAGANYSGPSNQLIPYIISGTGIDQNRAGASYTGETILSSSAVTLTTSWQRFTQTVTFPSTTTELAIYLDAVRTGTAGANDWFEVTGIQLELGSVATTFKRAGGTFQGELAACQRYFNRLIDGTQQAVGTLQAISATAVIGTRSFPEMRVGPTVTYTVVADFVVRSATNVILNATAANTFNISRQSASVFFNVAAGLVAGNAAEVFSLGNSTLDLSAEL